MMMKKWIGKEGVVATILLVVIGGCKLPTDYVLEPGEVIFKNGEIIAPDATIIKRGKDYKGKVKVSYGDLVAIEYKDKFYFFFAVPQLEGEVFQLDNDISKLSIAYLLRFLYTDEQLHPQSFGYFLKTGISVHPYRDSIGHFWFKNISHRWVAILPTVSDSPNAYYLSPVKISIEWWRLKTIYKAESVQVAYKGAVETYGSCIPFMPFSDIICHEKIRQCIDKSSNKNKAEEIYSNLLANEVFRIIWYIIMNVVDIDLDLENCQKCVLQWHGKIALFLLKDFILEEFLSQDNNDDNKGWQIIAKSIRLVTDIISCGSCISDSKVYKILGALGEVIELLSDPSPVGDILSISKGVFNSVFLYESCDIFKINKPDIVKITYYYPYTSCTGPTGWYKIDFSDNHWNSIDKSQFPWEDYRDADNSITDAFFRIYLQIPDSYKSVKLLIRSDDGSQVYVNEHYLGWLAGVGCHEEGCINYWGCGINHHVDTLDITSYVAPGINLIAVHVSNSNVSFYRIAFDFEVFIK